MTQGGGGAEMDTEEKSLELKNWEKSSWVENMKGRAPEKVEFAANAADTFRGSIKNESSTPARMQQEKQEKKGVENS